MGRFSPNVRFINPNQRRGFDQFLHEASPLIRAGVGALQERFLPTEEQEFEDALRAARLDDLGLSTGAGRGPDQDFGLIQPADPVTLRGPEESNLGIGLASGQPGVGAGLGFTNAAATDEFLKTLETSELQREPEMAAPPGALVPGVGFAPLAIFEDGPRREPERERIGVTRSGKPIFRDTRLSPRHQREQEEATRAQLQAALAQNPDLNPAEITAILGGASGSLLDLLNPGRARAEEDRDFDRRLNETMSIEAMRERFRSRRGGEEGGLTPAQAQEREALEALKERGDLSDTDFLRALGNLPARRAPTQAQPTRLPARFQTALRGAGMLETHLDAFLAQVQKFGSVGAVEEAILAQIEATEGVEGPGIPRPPMTRQQLETLVAIVEAMLDVGDG